MNPPLRNDAAPRLGSSGAHVSNPNSSSDGTRLGSVSLAPVIAAAEDCARRGFSVIPVRLDKRPAVISWKSAQTVRTEAADVREWFGRVKGTAGLGIILGAVSGDLYARDFDDPAAYPRWAAANPELAATLPTSQTGRGFHVYGRWKGVRTVTLSDGELRGEGAYVVAPPSPHASGGVYAWRVPLPDGPIPEIDPAAAGLARSWTEEGPRATERTESKERTEGTETPERTEATEDTEDDEAIRGRWNPETRAQIESAISRTIPPSAGNRNYQVFKLARALRGIPQLAKIRPERVSLLRPIVLEWYRHGLDKILTKDFGVTWGEFAHAWKSVRFPEGDDVMGAALEAAESAKPPGWAADYSPRCQLLASLCRELQRRAGANPFFLSNEKGGQCVGVDKGTANRYFGAFVADRKLRIVTPPTKTRATRYLYLGDDLHESGPSGNSCTIGNTVVDSSNGNGH